ncbi:MAG: DedA family protein [Candidatus Pacebacteria bacterium]|nr:DedA family protein [Candidatus Paceibacterota bacterium]
MVTQLLATLSQWTISAIDALGYWGVFFLMVLESANIPIPSEVTMPFAGFLASQGKLSLWWVITIGALGNLVGSLISYWCAQWIILFRLKSRFLRVLIPDAALERAQQWFDRWGDGAAFFSRLLPVVRTFISLPAGLARARLGRFSFFTFVGSLIWSALLTLAGFWLGEHWHDITPYLHIFSYAVAGILCVGGLYWLWAHGSSLWRSRKDKTPMV